MRIRWSLYGAAFLAFASFWTSGFLREGSGAYVVSCVILFFSSLTTWVGAIYIWAVAHRSGRSRILTLIALAPFGFLVGWLYVLLRGHELKQARGGAPSADIV